MREFIQSLESRQFLSATLIAAEARLSADFHALVSDAKSARTAVGSDVHSFVSDVKTLGIKNGKLKNDLLSAVKSAGTAIHADVSHILSGAQKDSRSILNELLGIYLLDGSNAAKLASDQSALAKRISSLRSIETPLLNKLAADVQAAGEKIGAAVQNVVAANPNDTMLSSDWNTLSAAVQSFGNSLVADGTTVLGDVSVLTTATP